MSSNIEEAVMEKLRVLPPEQQQEVLNFVEDLARQQTSAESTTEPQRMTIWEKIRKRAERVPDEVWEQMPRDGAEQHDHYLYGTPKK